MEHCFLAIAFKMGILNLNKKIYFNQKMLTKNIFLKFVYIFINAGMDGISTFLMFYDK